MLPTRTILHKVYRRLFQSFGPQKWWPGRTRFEIIVGAILTQNTNWGNVEKTIAKLRAGNLLNPEAINKISSSRLARLIQASGYYNIKARRLKNFVHFLQDEYSGRLMKMAREPWPRLREQLLKVNGIGPETADSILLYAFNQPVFVVDAYTYRIMSRHGLYQGPVDYQKLQQVFTENLEPDYLRFNEYHALLVRLGKEFCRSRPLCSNCPLNDMLPRGFTTL